MLMNIYKRRQSMYCSSLSKKVVSISAEKLKDIYDKGQIRTVFANIETAELKCLLSGVALWTRKSESPFTCSSVSDLEEYLCNNLDVWNNQVKGCLIEKYSKQLFEEVLGNSDSRIASLAKSDVDLLKQAYALDESVLYALELGLQDEEEALPNEEVVLALFQKFGGYYDFELRSDFSHHSDSKTDIVALAGIVDKVRNLKHKLGLPTSYSAMDLYTPQKPLAIRTGFNATSLLESEPRIMPLSHAPHNIGNSCFLNSILQVVTIMPEVVAAADPIASPLTKLENKSQRVEYDGLMEPGILEEFSLEETTFDFEKRQAVQHAFHNVLNELFNPTKSEPHLMSAITNLWKMIQAKQPELGGMYSQQDSVWALTAILESLNIKLPQLTIMSSAAEVESPPLYSVRTEPMIPVIHGAIVAKERTETICTVQEVVDSYHLPELMTGDEQYSHCGQKIDANKRHRIQDDPPFIAIQLKRYKNVGTILKPNLVRINDNVEPSATIDLPINAPEPIRKRLIGISCQSGGLGGGHYIAYRQAPDGKIYKYNDSSRSVSLGTKWDQLPPRELAYIRRNSYLLMYK
jgi:hypothetical protein